ncbi:tenascin-R [Elysia marginata]|uniref:Tenascin-R n=1 Tax=Elysia marginata TaxID=1093978 RepID=A0AAV4JKX9_9GAST|nr:tenascin-R [Elysia marginata]
MDKRLRAIFVLGLMTCAQGLDLNLEKNDQSVPGADNFCAILTCEDNTNAGTSKASSTLQLINSISSIAVFKKVTSKSVSNIPNNSSTEVLVASVTSAHPNVTEMDNGRKVDGVLDSRRARVRVELFRQEDCEAEFTCQVRGVDSQNTEVMETASLPGQAENQTHGGSLGLDILDSIRTIITQSVAGLEDRIETFERDLSQKVDTFQKTFEKRIADVEDNTRYQSRVVGGFMDQVQNFSERVKLEQGEALDNISETVRKSLNDTYDRLSSMESEFDAFKSAWNKTEALREFLAIDGIASPSLWNSTTNGDKDVLLTYNGNSRRKVTRSELKQILAYSDFRRASHLKSLLTHVIASDTCEKGMLGILNQSFPFPVTYPKNTLTFPFPCDTVTDGGGWIVIQRRAEGSTDFNRKWNDYKNGFGSFAGDFWLGNDKISLITKSGKYELRIDIVFDGRHTFAHYDSFSIESESYSDTTNNGYDYDYDYDYRRRSRSVARPYKLSIGNYDGTAGDSLRDNDGRPFSTIDKDVDSSGGNCAEEYQGGWWFVGCGYSCLNGRWGAGSNRGMEWRDLTGGLSVSFSEMKIRKVN